VKSCLKDYFWDRDTKYLKHQKSRDGIIEHLTEQPRDRPGGNCDGQIGETADKVFPAWQFYALAAEHQRIDLEEYRQCKSQNNFTMNWRFFNE